MNESENLDDEQRKKLFKIILKISKFCSKDKSSRANCNLKFYPTSQTHSSVIGDAPYSNEVEIKIDESVVNSKQKLNKLIFLIEKVKKNNGRNMSKYNFSSCYLKNNNFHDSQRNNDHYRNSLYLDDQNKNFSNFQKNFNDFNDSKNNFNFETGLGTVSDFMLDIFSKNSQPNDRPLFNFLKEDNFKVNDVSTAPSLGISLVPENLFFNNNMLETNKCGNNIYQMGIDSINKCNKSDLYDQLKSFFKIRKNNSNQYSKKSKSNLFSNFDSEFFEFEKQNNLFSDKNFINNKNDRDEFLNNPFLINFDTLNNSNENPIDNQLMGESLNIESDNFRLY